MEPTNTHEQPDDDHRWHIDRKVPLALVYLLIGQFLCGVVIAVNMYGQVANQDKRITIIENQRGSERLMTLESQMADAKALLQRVDANLLRLIERGSQAPAARQN